MEQFFQQLINGLSLGSIYALIALGYTMVYGIIKLINFAHGEVYMIGGYVGYFAIAVLGLPVLPAILIAMVVCAVIGVLIERVAYRPLRKAPRITMLITAIGVSFLLQYTVMFFVGPDVKTFPQMTNQVFDIFGVLINEQQVYILVITVVLMLILQFVVKKTKMGRAMRAVSVDPEAAQLMGININTTISFTFAIGSALAGAAGVLVGLYYNSIDPLMGVTMGLKAFIAAVFGGIGIIPGAMLGGFGIGFIEIFASGYISSLIKDGVVYGLLILILLVKPSGLLGKNEKEKV
ncbi:branched-chain amino acid ABC transporter permease [Culicoidibacter larvae]|uniref:Branched-chain amino acid ABC transporter permease n=1 Tax=Culicoidibacter larvae TaxID=2579976 RepID=A0A5R8QIR7_9FIRM|nr:branched-chain amino acid ABC transporter permease [Culicoidibacter larvae]TLG77147.1 branched-chain amino acid ABC transporter permease [Culicoidibacter larvae]